MEEYLKSDIRRTMGVLIRIGLCDVTIEHSVSLVPSIHMTHSIINLVHLDEDKRHFSSQVT